MTELVECVPNFSEGRREEVIADIVRAIAACGVYILDQQRDASHNRAVVTFVGAPEAVLKGAFAGAARAVERIDLRQHQGEHPRMGAVDVIPFVPFGELPLARCIELAHQLGHRIALELHVPVYYYGEAARVPERHELERVRRRGFEELRERIGDPDRRPDEGPPQVHPSAGAVAVGARIPLIAYNVNLRTADIGIAKAIATRIRASAGGFPAVKALGFNVTDHLKQVSMNLTDYRATGVFTAFSAIRALAREQDVEVEGSEIVGAIPLAALAAVVRDALQAPNFTADQVLEKKVWEAIEPAAPASDGRQERGPGRQAERALAELTIEAFLTQLKVSTPVPGGGSAAAVAGAMGAALLRMAAQISQRHVEGAPRAELGGVLLELDQLITRLTRLGQDDIEAFRGVMEARRLDVNAPGRADRVARALDAATRVPLGTAHAARHGLKIGKRIEALAWEPVASDVSTARHLLLSAFEGGLANVAINLRELSGPLRDQLQGEFDALNAVDRQAL